MITSFRKWKEVVHLVRWNSCVKREKWDSLHIDQKVGFILDAANIGYFAVSDRKVSPIFAMFNLWMPYKIVGWKLSWIFLYY